jgi:SPP1 family predicted phage head-tail adaptor
MTAIADLRHRVTFQSKTRSDDGGGGGFANWIDEFTVWAHVAPLSGFQKLKAEQLEATVTHTVTIRYRDGASAGMHIKYGKRIFDAKSAIDDDERHRWLVLMCEEIKEQ